MISLLLSLTKCSGVCLCVRAVFLLLRKDNSLRSHKKQRKREGVVPLSPSNFRIHPTPRPSVASSFSGVGRIHSTHPPTHSLTHSLTHRGEIDELTKATLSLYFAQTQCADLKNKVVAWCNTYLSNDTSVRAHAVRMFRALLFPLFGGVSPWSFEWNNKHSGIERDLLRQGCNSLKSLIDLDQHYNVDKKTLCEGRINRKLGILTSTEFGSKIIDKMSQQQRSSLCRF